jgi:hypothetical protein
MDIKERIELDFGSSQDVLFINGLDEAIIGFDQNIWSVVYSRNKVIDMLLNQSMNEDDAVKYAEDFIFSVLYESSTPVWVEDYSWL